MKKKHFIIFLLFSIFSTIFSEEIITLENGKKIILYEDHSWAEYTHKELDTKELMTKYKSELRQNIEATNEEIIIACEMYEQGWIYNMPRPKSAKAGWGISDGRTTWYNGWWYNSKTKEFSDTTPKKSKNGLYLGDNQNNANTWRNGGSPSRPDIYMFLLSKYGGPNH